MATIHLSEKTVETIKKDEQLLLGAKDENDNFNSERFELTLN